MGNAKRSLFAIPGVACNPLRLPGLLPPLLQGGHGTAESRGERSLAFVVPRPSKRKEEEEEMCPDHRFDRMVRSQRKPSSLGPEQDDLDGQGLGEAGCGWVQVGPNLELTREPAQRPTRSKLGWPLAAGGQELLKCAGLNQHVL